MRIVELSLILAFVFLSHEFRPFIRVSFGMFFLALAIIRMGTI